jgi:hypothetical protein
MSYRVPKNLKPLFDRAVNFIAFNDEPGDLSFKSVRGYISTITVAETLGIHVEMVARAVVKKRRAELKK